ncbi:dynein intermediate chain 3, axonemal isoform X1 [Ornithorhynchus anatinus]|uniref:dynein intermediate chain 3, axonemal isoform X1 n=1 Tax=Ornithorhynchus anatinus TaxID=9258 RepID=UPI0010A90F4F|nr:dynein intermediate chain 3, axonemal isoform X1 [Ornithorhynchus anatinus]
MSKSPRSAKSSKAKGTKSKDSKKSGSVKGKQKIPIKDEEISISMASSDHTEIIPLLLTTKTQEIFNCQPDIDVTEENPNKLIKKEDIIQDMRNRAAISDFYPVKKIVLEYPGEELLIVFDKDFTYGQNFYLAATEEIKESILLPLQEKLEKEEKESVEEEYVYNPPVPKPWVSLGSEKEIEEESVKGSQIQIKYMISRTRKEFGAPVEFADYNASSEKGVSVDCSSYPDKHFSIRQLEKDAGTQVVPKIKEKTTQTKWKFPKNATTQYFPREFSEEEKESLLESETLKDFLNSVSVSVEIALQQNEIMNVFYDDWKSLAEDDGSFGDKSDSYLKEYQSFTDLHNIREKTITCISWHPTIYGLLAVSVAERLSYENRVQFSGKLLLQPSLILFWSFSDPIHPQLMLESPDDIFCFRFCPSDPNIIAGGCFNGQIVLWDITAHREHLEVAKSGTTRSKKATLKPIFLLEPDSNKEAPYVRHSAVSSIEHGHRKVITDIHWLSDFFEINRLGATFENRSGLCCQLVTCSADCTVLFWDIRPAKPSTDPVDKKKEETVIEVPYDVPATFLHLDLSWKPLIKITLPKGDTSLDHCLTRISLSEEYLHYKMQDKLQVQSKALKPEEESPYKNLTHPVNFNLKPLEDISTNFFAGTEDGELIYSDWKLEKNPDSGRLTCQKPINRFLVHDGSVVTVQRSPFFKDIILTVGGWNFGIWKEGLMVGPILLSCCSTKRYTAGHWSLSRAGVFFLGREDGNIEIWDLLEKTHEPSQTQNICIAMITYMRPWIFSSKQQFIAVSDNNGTLHILEIPWTLSHPSLNEICCLFAKSVSVRCYLEREVKHLEYVGQRKEFREKERKEMELEAQRKKSRAAPPQKSREQMEAEVKLEYEEYLALERNILLELGLIKEQEVFPVH